MGSAISAGRNVTVAASGAGADSHINVIGSTISAGNQARLAAEGNVNLQAAQSTSSQHSTQSGSSAAVGVSFTVGSQNGFALNAGVAGNRGHADGDSTTWTNTRVTAGETLTLQSGGDTNLKGAVASGTQVVADVGGNLNVESLQSTDHYDSKQQSAGVPVSACVPPFCSGGSSSAAANLSQQRMQSDYASVGEQSGIQAADGGFQIKVTGNTDLKGGVIASSDQAVHDGVNTLTTATLTHSDIENHASYEASSVGMSGGVGGQIGKDQKGTADNVNPVPGTTLPSQDGLSVAPPVAIAASREANATTKSGISGGAIHITDSAKQQQLTGQTAAEALASINRDTANTEGALAPIFDKEKVQAGFDIASQFVNEVGTFVANRAAEAEAAKHAAHDPNLTPEQRAQAQAKADALARWEPGGSYRRVATALTAAAGGNVTGEMGQFALDATVNYVQGLAVSQVKQMADLIGSESARASLHAIVACAGAAASSQRCGAGAMGAAASSVLGSLLGATTGLSEPEKDAQTNLVTSLVAAVAVAGTAGNGAATAMNAAGTETLYNRQLHDQEREWAKKSAKQFAAAYEEKTGRAITDEKAESLLLGTGYMMVDDKARVGPGYDMAAAQYISENSGDLFKATAAERADLGPLGGPLTPEQLALPGHEAHPEIGMAAGAGVGLFALGAVAPTAATAWALGTAYDYAGDVISWRKGWSSDGPKIGKSLVVGGVASAASPFFLPLKTLGGSTTGKIVVGGYNSVLAGTTVFGSTAITGSGSADLSAGVGAGSYMLGTAMTTMLPGPLGNYLYQFNQILSGPAQNAITNAVNKKE